MLPERVLLYGRDAAPPEPVELHAGPLTLMFDEGDLRYIRFGKHEAVRRIYAAVRDRNWATIPAVVTNRQVKAEARSFVVTYDAEHRQGPIHFRWSARITGEESGRITFSFEGKAVSTFLRNRIGICVLHPIAECAGAPCTVEHGDGSREAGAFPKFVSPNQPFLDMRAITHEVLPGVKAEVRFTGDIFEMEDQRNWTDGSYKTYSTPLKLPFPVEVAAGTEIRQSVTISLSGNAPAPNGAGASAVALSLSGGKTGRLPALGLGMASSGAALTPGQKDRLRPLRLAHLRADLDLSRETFPARLMAVSADAAAVNAGLELALFVTDQAEAELGRLAGHLKASTARIDRFLVFHQKEKSTSARWVALARRALQPVRPKAQIVTGTNAYLAELNRERPAPGSGDGVTFSANPQVHAFDESSLVENLAAQTDAVQSVLAFAKVPVVVSPVTLRPRFNPNATGPEPPPAPGQLPFAVDPRQMSLFTAAWTLASIKYLTQGGAASVTWYETAGWRGVMADDAVLQQPAPFPETAGMVYPVYFVFESLAGLAGGEVLPVTSTAPREVEAFAIRKDGRTRVFAANLTPHSKTVSLPWAVREVRRLDAGNAENLMRDPSLWRSSAAAGKTLMLPPYAIAAAAVS